MRVARLSASTSGARVSSVVRPPFRLLVLVAVLATSGCGLLLPYDRAVIVDSDRSLAPPGLAMAGDAENALSYVEELREKYFGNLRTSFAVRGLSGAAGAGLGAWALYNALKPEEDTTPVGDKRRTARLGAGLAGLLGLRTLFVQPDQEKAYADGYQALTCLMVQSTPLLMTTRSTTDRRSAEAEWAGRWPADWGDIERLQWQLALLEQQIHDFNVTVDLYDNRIENVFGPGTRRDRLETERTGDYLRGLSAKARKALEYARNAFKDGNLLLDAGKHAGDHIRNGAALVVSANNIVIQGMQKEAPDAAKLLGSQHDIMSSVLSIGAETEADQVETATRGTATAVSQTVGGPLATLRTVDWRPTIDRPDLIAVATVAPRAGSGLPVARGGKKVSVASKKTGKSRSDPTTGATAPIALTTSVELKALRAKLDATIKSLDDAEAERKRKQAIEDVKRAEDRLTAKARAALSCRAFPSNSACTESVLRQMEDLYFARRPVAQAVLNFRERARQVEAIPECAARATLRVVPSGPMEAYPGSTLEFIVSQRSDTAAPFAALQAPIDGDTGAQLAMEAVPGTNLKKIVVRVGKTMPPQRFRIVISDSRQTATQVLVVTVRKPLPKPDDKPAATSS